MPLVTHSPYACSEDSSSCPASSSVASSAASACRFIRRLVLGALLLRLSLLRRLAFFQRVLLFFRFEAQRDLLALLELFVFLFKAHADHMQIHLFHVQTRHGFNGLAHVLLRAAANLLDGHAVIDRHADVNADVLAVHIHAHAARQLALAQQAAVARNGGDAVHFRGGHAHDGRNDFIGVAI